MWIQIYKQIAIVTPKSASNLAVKAWSLSGCYDWKYRALIARFFTI